MVWLSLFSSNQTVAGLKLWQLIDMIDQQHGSNQTVAGLKLERSAFKRAVKAGSNQTVAGLKLRLALTDTFIYYCSNQTVAGLKHLWLLFALLVVDHGSNQTVAGLKLIQTTPCPPPILEVQIRPLRDWNCVQCLRAVRRGGRFKSDRCGIETIMIVFNDAASSSVQIRPLRDWNVGSSAPDGYIRIEFKSDRCGIETNLACQICVSKYRSNQTVAGLKLPW